MAIAYTIWWKLYSLARFPVDYYYYPLMPSLVFLWGQFDLHLLIMWSLLSHNLYLLLFCILSIFNFAIVGSYGNVLCCYKKDVDSLFRLTLLRYVHIILCAIFFVYCLKYPLSCFFFYFLDFFLNYNFFLCPCHIYQPLRSGRIWHRVNF